MPADPSSATEPDIRRVGVLLPWANQAVEEELPQLGEPGVVFHYARLVPASRTTAVDDAFWHGLRAAATGAVDSMRHLPLDATVLACTSAAFTGGPELPPGVITAFDALTTVLHQRRLARIVLATPYPQPVTRAEAAALGERGIQVLAHASLGLDDGYPAINPQQILDLCASLPPAARAGADALVLSCTGWRTLTAATALHKRLRIPVISSNHALAHILPPAPGAAP
ncbi:maleate cis-trans isomerase family protein [Streptomyces eurythermus]|uniref:maleate cis-trans isomerase family protein n=1 Tax=Streptomyces eurythermus TaxID=42237 RepID=UPI003404C2FF